MRRLGDLSLIWSREQVTAENKVLLRSLLPSIRFEVGGKRLLLVHGSPRKINEYLYEDRPLSNLERIASDADVLIFGTGARHVNDENVDGQVHVSHNSLSHHQGSSRRMAQARCRRCYRGSGSWSGKPAAPLCCGTAGILAGGLQLSA